MNTRCDLRLHDRYDMNDELLFRNLIQFICV
jgi:hypothetical protein